MRLDYLALRGLPAIAALFAVAMLSLGALISQGFTQFLVPTPETTAEQFLGALKAHRYQAARDQLGQELARQIDEGQLRSLARSIEAGQGGIADAHGEDSQEQGDSATATATVKLGSGRVQRLEFPLGKEEGIWKLRSIEPLMELPEVAMVHSLP